MKNTTSQKVSKKHENDNKNLDNIISTTVELIGNTKIKYIGIRHGEKMYESLISSEEMMMTEDLGDFYRIKPDNRNLNYSKYFDDGNKELEGLSEYNSDNTERLDIISLVELLRKEGFDNSSAS